MTEESQINQFRRDPVSGQWSIILKGRCDIAELISQPTTRQQKKQTPEITKYSAGAERKTPPEIFAIREEGSQKDQPGWKVRVIPMKQPFLQIFGDLNNRGVGMYDVLDGIGAHELVIESPRINDQLSAMPCDQVQNVLLAYRARILDLKRDPRFRYIMVHKHYGEGDDDLRAHSHSHIIATPITPTRVKTELVNAMEHYRFKERCLFCDIIFLELSSEKRVVLQNKHFVALTPFASRAPFTVMILPKKHETFFEWNNEPGQLAEILQKILQKIRIVLNDPNYIMVLHTGPNITTGKDRGYWRTLERDYHWHIEITPRFRTFASFEIGSGFQVNAVAPELAAEILRTEKLK